MIPKNIPVRALELGHLRHPGKALRKRTMRSKLWWPGMDKTVEKKTCRSYHGCQLVISPSKLKPMTRTQLSDAPMGNLAADFKRLFHSGDHMFVLVDYYSTYRVAEIIRSTSSEKNYTVFEENLKFIGQPLSITTYNAPQFVSKGRLGRRKTESIPSEENQNCNRRAV